MKLFAEIWELKKGTEVFIDDEETGSTVALVNPDLWLTNAKAAELGRIMAAAIELLEACKAADRADSYTHERGAALLLIRSAIAKAEGRAVK